VTESVVRTDSRQKMRLFISSLRVAKQAARSIMMRDSWRLREQYQIVLVIVSLRNPTFGVNLQNMSN